MDNISDNRLAHDPLEAKLTTADDRVRLNHWMPPQSGIVPLIRFRTRWYSVLWALPIAFVLLVIGVAVAQALRQLPGVQDFLVRYPGIPPDARAVTSGFPVWLRISHFLNLFFMTFIIRAGVQILADHPRLYWRRDCTPGTDWFRFQKPVPTGRVWTAKDDSVTIPGWLGIPGIRHSIGLARWWHFSVNMLWVLNGIAIYALLFSTDQWQRLVPTTWEVFPNAVSTALQYLSLTFPIDHGWTRYNSLQQLAYFATVFVAAPTSIVTGFMQSPSLSNHLGWFGRVLNRQRARSIHFLALWWFLLFILAHVTLVFITGARVNLNMMWAGVNDGSWSGFAVFFPLITLVAVAWWLASPFIIRHARAGAAHRTVHDRPDQGPGRVVGPAERADREGHLAVFLAERHHAGLGRIRGAGGERLCRLWAPGGRAGGAAAHVQPSRAAGDAAAGTDHDTFLHPGLDGCREMGRRPDAPHPRPGPSDRRGSLRGVLLAAPMARMAAATTTCTGW